MNARFPYLFALALTLPLSSCRFVGMKPDFSVMGDAFSPVATDSVYVESKPTQATQLASYKRPAPPTPTQAPQPSVSVLSLFSQSQPQHPAAQVQPQATAPRPQAPAAKPQPAAYSQVQPTPAAPAATTYTVRPGDSLARIARAHKVPLGSLAAVNGIDLQTPLIKPGQQLRIPQGGAAVVTARVAPAPTTTPNTTTPAATAPRATKPTPLLTLAPASNAHSAAAASPAAAARPAATAATAKPAVAPAPKGTYRVCAGDTLYRIARRHGISLQELLRANNLDEVGARNVRVGTLLTIPTKP